MAKPSYQPVFPTVRVTGADEVLVVELSAVLVLVDVLVLDAELVDAT